MAEEIKEFRMFNAKTASLTYFDFFDVADGKVKFDFSEDNSTIITSYTGRMDNDEVPVPLYEADIVKIIRTNIVMADDVKIGVIEFIPNYSAYGVVFNDGESKLLCECFENTIIRVGNTFEGVKS